MAVIALSVFQGAVSCLVLALMIYLLVRAPRNVPLCAVTITTASFAVMFVIQWATMHGGVLGLDPITSRLVQHFAMVLGGYGLIVFFLFSALDTGGARRRAMWQAVPVAVAAVIMTTATVLMPVDIRDAAAGLTWGRPGPVAEPTVALLHLTVYLYMAYAFTAALLWTRRYARGAEPRLRRGLMLVSVGLAALAPAQAMFTLAAIRRWTGGALPHPVVMSAVGMLLGGTVIFVIGVAYPAVDMRLAALRVWWQHRRGYRRLGPLWTALHQEFPEDAFNRVPASRWRDVLRLRGVHRRYYRRVIECRDGLVRVSPYLGSFGEQKCASILADRLREGLRAHASGAPTASRATPVAIPAADGLDADVNELVALSEALRASSRSS